MKSKSEKNSLVNRFKRYWILYVMMLPAIVYFILIKYAPMFGLSIAFKNYVPWDGIAGSEFVGFKYFMDVFKDGMFYLALKNTFVINIVKLSIVIFMAIVISILLNEIKIKFIKKAIQTITFMPYLISWAVVAVFVFNIFSSDYGYLNKIIEVFGGEAVDWYNTTGIWKAVIELSYVWKFLGWNCIFYLAALAGISPDLYEAAIADGAGRFRRIWSITIPSLLPMIVLTVSVNISFLLLSDFEQVYSIIGNRYLLIGETEVLNTYIYRAGIGGSQYSFAAALGLVTSVISLILFMTSNKLIKVFFKDDSLALY